MNFIVTNKSAVNGFIALSMVIDVIISILINILTQEEFNIFSKHNLILCGILVFLVILLIICNIIQHNAAPQTKSRKLQKAFQENGGYEVVVEEMKKCFVEHDAKSLKDLKKMIELIEK